MTILRNFACVFVLLEIAFACPSARAVSVVHWINNSNQNASNVVNSGSPFLTSFRSAGEVTVTRLINTAGSLFTDNFGGATPGNNPAYLTSFVGAAASGTGNGQAGYMGFFDLGGAATGSTQFDFAQPLTSADRLLFVDADSTEQYKIEAFGIVDSSYVPLSLGGWIYETFSGQTGVTPDNRWPTWNPGSALLTASTSGLNEELSVLTPDQPVSRLKISKLTGGGASTGFQVIEITGITGDYNANDVIDAADYGLWRKNANTGNVLINDPIGGTIGAPQYSQWRTRYGQGSAGSGSVVSTAAVPEPLSAIQVMLVSVMLSIRHRRTRMRVA